MEGQIAAVVGEGCQGELVEEELEYQSSQAGIRCHLGGAVVTKERCCIEVRQKSICCGKVDCLA